MARLARVVVPGYQHHITQRGNRRQQTFFSDEDYQSYIDLMADWCKHFNVEIWSYCLMPNHTHLIAVPATSNGLASAIGEGHRRYALNQMKGMHYKSMRESGVPLVEMASSAGLKPKPVGY